MKNLLVLFLLGVVGACSSSDPNDDESTPDLGEWVDGGIDMEGGEADQVGGDSMDDGGGWVDEQITPDDTATRDDAGGGGDSGGDDDDASIRPTDPYLVETAWNFAPGLVTPVVIRSAVGPITKTVTVTVGNQSQKVQLYRGLGSGSFVTAESETLSVKVTGTDGFTTTTLGALMRPERTLSGVLTGDDLVWTNDQDIVLISDITIPQGETLTIGSGVRVKAAAKVNLVVEGAMEALGTKEEPILFAAKDNNPWGGVRVMGGSALLNETWFTGGGGDGTFAFGHSKSQPVVFAQSGVVTLNGGGVVDNPGKAFGGKDATVTLTDTLVSRCDTGGEFEDSWVNMNGAYVVEIPNGDGLAADDDNDCVYLVGAMIEDGAERVSTLTNIVFFAGKDDGIDHNNARVLVDGAWIENMAHEGVAASNGRGIVVKNSVVRKNNQGIEAGYGAPDVVVDHCLVVENQVGLRFGDEYDWKATGKLTVKNTISVKNSKNNVLNDDTGSGGEVPGAIDIQCSMVNDSEWDGKGGNLPGVPSWDSYGCLLDGSPGKNAACDGNDVGVACFGD